MKEVPEKVGWGIERAEDDELEDWRGVYGVLSLFSVSMSYTKVCGSFTSPL